MFRKGREWKVIEHKNQTKRRTKHLWLWAIPRGLFQDTHLEANIWMEWSSSYRRIIWLVGFVRWYFVHLWCWSVYALFMCPSYQPKLSGTFHSQTKGPNSPEVTSIAELNAAQQLNRLFGSCEVAIVHFPVPSCSFSLGQIITDLHSHQSTYKEPERKNNCSVGATELRSETFFFICWRQFHAFCHGRSCGISERVHAI